MGGDGPVVGLHFKPCQVTGNWIIQVQSALIVKLHQRYVGEGLGEGLADGPYLEYRVRLDWLARSQVGVSESGYL